MEYIDAKTIVTKTKSREWFGIDYNMNIYKGCCHGCIYCDSRSDCYQIKNFDEVRAKKDALRIIRDDLRRKVKTGVVGTGAMSDPYNPLEKQLLLTRHALELVDAFGFGAAVATKSDLILRDQDIYSSILEHSPVLVKITITTPDERLAGLLEPKAPPPSRRLEAAARLSEAGIFAGILLMPVLPWLEDSEENVCAVIERAREAGARFIYPSFGVTLRANQREWYFDRLKEIYPGKGLPDKYMKKYGNQYVCISPNAKRLWQVFSERCEKYGILYRMKDIIHAYQKRYQITQHSLFDI